MAKYISMYVGLWYVIVYAHVYLCVYVGQSQVVLYRLLDWQSVTAHYWENLGQLVSVDFKVAISAE